MLVICESVYMDKLPRELQIKILAACGPAAMLCMGIKPCCDRVNFVLMKRRPLRLGPYSFDTGRFCCRSWYWILWYQGEVACHDAYSGDCVFAPKRFGEGYTCLCPKKRSVR